MKVVMATGGSFNCGIRLRFDDDKPDWFVRFPMPGHSMFRDEKTRNEVAVMKYVEEHTKIPVPHIIAYGMSDENPTGLGPFIIMNWVEGKKMSEILSGSTSEEREKKLDHDINTSLLKTLYGRMADILLELWDHKFDAIGCLEMDNARTPTTWTAKHRPLTLEMNELVRCMGISGESFPKAPFHSASDYIFDLSTQQFNHLSEQRNSVWNSQDCREKYTSRHLLQALIPYFMSKDITENNGPFRLFCDDLCPNNVLVDEETLEVTAVIDWEFTYAAPALFTTCAPWWLILRKPEDWSGTTKDFEDQYTPRLELFLETMKERETVRGGNTSTDLALSTRMRKSIEEKTFWFAHAVRKTINVDSLYWSALDVYCHGPRKSIAERVYTSTTLAPKHFDRETFVRRKISDLRDYNLERGEEEAVEHDEMEEYIAAVR